MRRVLVLNTGGTIGMQDTPHGFACGPPGFLTDICRSVPMIHDSAFAKQLSTTSQPAAEQEFEDHMMVTPLGEFGTRTSFQIIDYDPLLDSSNMTHVDWVRIASDIDARYSKWDAFVVLHGTDTMAFTCSALSFMLQNLGKTVVVTGSQIPLSRSRSDGISNFLGALLIAGTFNIPEVTLYFADELYRGNRASKVDASGLHAFKSPNMSPLATLGVTCSVRWDLVRPASPGRLRLKPEFETNLVIIRVFPGPFTTLRNTLRPPLRGAILQTFGAGNAPDRDPDFLQALREASDRGVVIVNVTQCSSGTVEPHYATGQSLETAGVIPGGDMTPEAALVKLGWLLGCGLDGEQVRKMMRTDLCGELTDRRTQRFSLGDGGFLRCVRRITLTSTGIINRLAVPCLQIIERNSTAVLLQGSVLGHP
jgi:lysophospholipase